MYFLILPSSYHGSRRCRTILRRQQVAMTMAHGMGSRRCPTILRTGQVAMTMADVVGVGGNAMRTTGHRPTAAHGAGGGVTVSMSFFNIDSPGHGEDNDTQQESIKMILKYDVIVIGAGHAGCEAAAAAARLGAHTCLVTMDMNKIAQMSCNPAVGGIAKGQIVREIDALGGRMGIVTDRTAIQFRMLNRSKGPAMWSPRAQCDRERFIWEWRHQLDTTPGLDIWQDQVMELLTEAQEDTTLTDGPKRRVTGVRTLWGVDIMAPAVIITAGTFLNGMLHIGRKMLPGGRIAEPAALRLTESVNTLGIRSDRMKTGTPVRIDARSVDFGKMELQQGDPVTHLFSYMHGTESIDSQYLADPELFSRDCYASPRRPRTEDFLPCWTTQTNSECHDVLRSGLKDSPLFNGQIQSIGPRYCPSVETKLVTFADKDSHPLFLEPEGTDTNEMYLNGFSSSMPMEIQIEALRKIPAFKELRVYRPGYAIEYDFFDPTQLHHSLESRLCSGLFFAGQVNGTTGYEEAAGQGLVAGVNAAISAGHHATGTDLSTAAAARPLVLGRDEAYIGVLIDDLVMKGVDEPYRMFTSRAEYRILLRQDDADRRLTPIGHSIGLATTSRLDIWKRKEKAIDDLHALLRSTTMKQDEINPYLDEIGSTRVNRSVHLDELLTRPGVTLAGLQELRPELTADDEVTEATEILIKYDGYIRREREYADKMHRLEDIKIDGHFDYNSIQSLSTEARQKLTARRPDTLAHASRIPGISPSDINVLLVLLGR